MGILKRITSAILSSAIAFSVIAFAPASSASAAVSDTKGLYKTLYDGINNRTTVIDISKYSATENDVSTVTTILSDAWSFSYGAVPVTNNGALKATIQPKLVNGKIILGSVTLSYTTDAAYSSSRKSAYATAKSNILKTIDKSTDLTKICGLMKWFRTNVTYTAGVADDGKGYGALVNKKAVCQGIAVGFADLCTDLGLECYVEGSTAMNHAWNKVKVDGKWYHIDVTSIVCTAAKNGNVWYVYKKALKSDAVMKSLGAHDWRACQGWTEQAANSELYSRAAFELSSWAKGDVNLNGVVDITDITTLGMWIADNSTPNSLKKYADYDGNGVVNTSDLAALRQYVSKH